MRSSKAGAVRAYAVILLAVLFSSSSWASMGNIATTYGVLPYDMATAQALSLFNTQVSSTYYNPAYLVQDSRGELTGGMFHAEHELRADSQGGSNPPNRDGDVLQDEPSQHVLIGMKTDLSDLTKVGHPLYLGFVAGVEKYGQEMLAFESKTSRQGQYFQYGREPLFLNLGGGTRIWKGLDAGLAARITLHSQAELYTQTDLAGNTQYEELNVSAEPDIRGILGLNMDWGETFCEDGGCWYDGLEAAFSYRQSSNTQTSVEATTVIPGTIPSPGLSLAITTLDSYQPSILAAGASWKNDAWRVGLTLEQQRWSDLEDEFDGDTIKDQADWNFDDIVIPRIGAEYKLNQHFTLISGLAYQESPLQNERSLDVNYFDTDRVVLGLGVSAQYQDPWLLAYPVQLDFGYQYHQLRERDFELTASNAPNNPYETVTAEGDVHVVAGSITLKF
jgi:long-subunit fatty acid transport protein